MTQPTEPPFLAACDDQRQGKVRNIFRFGDVLLLEASNRISVFDVVLPTEIPDKGRVLAGLTAFWLKRYPGKHHLITTDPDEMRRIDRRIDFGTARTSYEGRCMLVRRLKMHAIECVIRGYITGSGWKEYKQSQSVCDIRLPAGLQESARLDEPIYTPATKAETGHDENIPFERTIPIVGGEYLAKKLRDLSVQWYADAAAYAASRGIIIADTKFEFGSDGKCDYILADEVLTPDSSRFWPASEYAPGRAQASFDKQFVRDWAEQSGWDKTSTNPPALPVDVVAGTRQRYLDAYELLTGQTFPWK